MAELVKSYTYGEEIPERVLVKFSQEGTVVKATSPEDNVCGVAMYHGQSGAKGDVKLLGMALVETTGAVNAGDFLMATTGGKAKVLNLTDIADGTIINVVGQALETSSTGAHLWVVIKPQTISAHIPDEDAAEETQG